MFRMEANLVGMRFRPPAEDVVRNLPGNAELLLVRDHENQYDLNAIKVLLPGFGPEGVHKELWAQTKAQVEPNSDLEDNLTDPLWLGFICNGEKTGGKMADLLVAQIDPLDIKEVPAKLSFNARGAPLVVVEQDFAAALLSADEDGLEVEEKSDESDFMNDAARERISRGE